MDFPGGDYLNKIFSQSSVPSGIGVSPSDTGSSGFFSDLSRNFNKVKVDTSGTDQEFLKDLRDGTLSDDELKKFEDAGFSWEKNEDGEWEYYRDKTAEEKTDQAIAAIEGISQVDPGGQLIGKGANPFSGLGSVPTPRTRSPSVVPTSAYAVPEYLSSSSQFDANAKNMIKGLLSSPKIRKSILGGLI